jgi:hypothetical protein
MGFTKKVGYYTGTVWEWNLPTGSTCPFALECKVTVDRDTGKFMNESRTYRCYAANAERFPGVRKSRWENFEAGKAGAIPALPKGCKAVRIHASGDFFNQKYFDTWLDYCRAYPEVEFWAYTKSLTYWVKRISEIPGNLILTASYGGRNDFLIDMHLLKSVRIFESEEAVMESLRIDTNDDYARMPKVHFALIDNFKPKQR